MPGLRGDHAARHARRAAAITAAGVNATAGAATAPSAASRASPSATCDPDSDRIPTPLTSSNPVLLSYPEAVER
jgi:hypothetical protein